MNAHLLRFLKYSACCSVIFFTSCIYEGANTNGCDYPVRLNVHSDTDWLPDLDINATRADGYEVGYTFQVFNRGDLSTPVKELTIFSDNLSYLDFSIDIDLKPGNYDVYAWAQICNSSGNIPLFYDSSNFSRIVETDPNIGDSEYKNALRGMTSFTVENSGNLLSPTTGTIVLTRPLARYQLIASDLHDFIENQPEEQRASDPAKHSASDDLSRFFENYRVRISYSGYLPTVFDAYANNPVDSSVGISFEGPINVISDSEALLAFDYVMVNGDESAVSIVIGIYDLEGNPISSSNPIEIPTKRNRTTVVYGKFLTTDGEGGVNINPDFNGQYNIKYN